MKYDDSEYFFLNYTTDKLSNDAAATHIGMYMAWIVLHELVSPWHLDEDADTLRSLKARAMTPGSFAVDWLDGKLLDDDLSDLGNTFTSWYYAAMYLDDYGALFGVGAETTDEYCSVTDSWDNFDRLAPILDRRFEQWKQLTGFR